MPARIVAIVLVLAVATVAMLLAIGTLRIPDRYNPFAPLSIDDAPTFVTGYKLARLSGDEALCRTALATSPFSVRWLPDRELRDGCGHTDAVRIEATSIAIGDAFTLSCEGAVALALWERHVLQPAAVRHLGVPVARLHHFGSYACRNVYGGAHGRRSEHATANALDVAGFTLADGRRVGVRRDWDGDDAEARFLRDAHAGACRFFNAALGPDYNAAHRDHFHFDRGRFRVCR